MAARRKSPPPGSRGAWTTLALLFAAALLVRAGIFGLPHREVDERIYGALAERLAAGKGYTLQGHPILLEDFIVRDQYDKPLFHHPPGGIAFLGPFHLIFGARGLALGELASFALFFWSLVALARGVFHERGGLFDPALGLVAGFTPIVAHVHMHYWLDGPQVALATAGAACLVRVSGPRGTRWAVVAGLLLAWSALTKLNTILAFPGMLALAWAVAPNEDRRVAAARGTLAIAIAVAAAIPWLAAQRAAYGEMFPSWAGKPSPELVRTNPFVRFVTESRTPWSYLRLLPQVVWTLVPSIAACAALRGRPRVRRLAPSLLLWIAVIVGAHIALGFLGYSKLLRYVVLVVPATAMLFLLAVAEGIAKLRERRLAPRRRAAAAAIAALLAAGLVLETAHGLQAILVFPDRAVIRNLWGELS